MANSRIFVRTAKSLARIARLPAVAVSVAPLVLGAAPAVAQSGNVDDAMLKPSTGGTLPTVSPGAKGGLPSIKSWSTSGDADDRPVSPFSKRKGGIVKYDGVDGESKDLRPNLTTGAPSIKGKVPRTVIKPVKLKN